MSDPLPPEEHEKPSVPGTNPDDDDRREVDNKDAVWEEAVITDHDPDDD